MLLNAYYWKDELLRLSEETKRYSTFTVNEELDYPDVPYCELRLERALLYSAFAIRLLYESEKLTDRMKGYNLSVEEIPNIVEDPNLRLPLFRKFATDDNYDFSVRKRSTIPGLQLTNQLIHSHVALSFEYEEDEAVGFYVASDRTVDDRLYYCTLVDWLRFLSAVISDEITSVHTYYDKEREKWITQRS